ncbi:hypothetical protein [Campylobacter vulpis]|uniref:hypothetical protein n=1 Tax=Campylobacter vulpis TaxID=1655500 RepID=UPI0015DF6E82|nr:hypothetical protein [Campylobacter vulpis]
MSLFFALLKVRKIKMQNENEILKSFEGCRAFVGCAWKWVWCERFGCVSWVIWLKTSLK